MRCDEWDFEDAALTLVVVHVVDEETSRALHHHGAISSVHTGRLIMPVEASKTRPEGLPFSLSRGPT